VPEGGRSWWFHDPDWRPVEQREAVSSLVEETAAWLAAVACEQVSHGS